MRVLVIGSGGREHALCWKLSQESDVHCAPGNPGTLLVCTNHDVSPTDTSGLIKLAQQIQPQFVLIGPENPLISGLADALRESGHLVIGPGAQGAKLEASKAYSKDIMIAAGVPTAASETFSDPDLAIRYVKSLYDSGQQVAVKASGAALGKGVIVCDSESEAIDAIDRFLVRRELGDAGTTLVIEERLLGREFSLITLCNENSFCSLPIAQDYKRVGDGDSGPNTGGMGSYSPVNWVSHDLIKEAEDRIVRPVLEHLKEIGISYRGVLFSGIMLTDSGPKCLEYNVRFGDPETQSIMGRLGTGLAQSLLETASGTAISKPEVLSNAAATLVLASKGYPQTSSPPALIELPDELPNGVQIFAAGVTEGDEGWMATGGRVLNVMATSDSLDHARKLAYQVANLVRFDGCKFRTDIAEITSFAK